MLPKCERTAFELELNTRSEANQRISSRKNAFFTGEFAIFTVASALSEVESLQEPMPTTS